MYVVTQSFKAKDGKTYRMGDLLTDAQYDALAIKEKTKCKEKRINVISYDEYGYE